MEKVTNNRIEWIDALKGFAIVWLMVYHFYVFEWVKSPVGVFFFLSGMFFSSGTGFGGFVKKKIKALIIPFCFFFVIGISTRFLGAFVQSESFSFPPTWKMFTLLPIEGEDINPIGVGAIWFLLALFDIYVIYYGIVQLSNNRWWIIGASIFSLILSAILLQKYHIGSLCFLFNALFFLPYFALGNILKNFVLKGKYKVWLLLLLIMMYSTSYLDLSYLKESMGGGILLKIKDIVSGISLVLILIHVFRSLSVIIKQKAILFHKFLLLEGENSLTILGVHMVFQMVYSVLLLRFIPVGILYWLVLFALEIISSNICVLLFNRYIPFFVNKKDK